jgi:hypothetical protein
MEEAPNSSNAHLIEKIIVVYTWSEYPYLTQHLIDVWEQM